MKQSVLTHKAGNPTHGIHDRPSTPADKLPELAQLVMENEGLRRKHRKVQHRRDHYARLYYRCQADFDEKKWELHYTRIKISELKEQRKYCITL
jgi:hypothetical protein